MANQSSLGKPLSEKEMKALSSLLSPHSCLILLSQLWAPAGLGGSSPLPGH